MPDKSDLIETRLRQLETLEAVARIAKNEDFKVVVQKVREDRDYFQQQYNGADLTKPIPTAELKGKLNYANLFLETLDTSETVVKQLKHEVAELSKPVATGRGGRAPISHAVLPIGER